MPFVREHQSLLVSLVGRREHGSIGRWRHHGKVEPTLGKSSPHGREEGPRQHGGRWEAKVDKYVGNTRRDPSREVDGEEDKDDDEIEDERNNIVIGK